MSFPAAQLKDLSMAVGRCLTDRFLLGGKALRGGWDDDFSLRQVAEKRRPQLRHARRLRH